MDDHDAQATIAALKEQLAALQAECAALRAERVALRDELREATTREIRARYSAALERRQRQAREREDDPEPERGTLQ